MSTNVLFENYIGAYKLRIYSTDKKIYIYDCKNNFRCDFYKSRIREVIKKLMIYADVISNESPCSCFDDTSECAVYTNGLGIKGYAGNWCKTDRIKPMIEKLAEVCSDLIEKCKDKIEKPKTRGQLKRMKLATLISLAKDIDNEKRLLGTITI